MYESDKRTCGACENKAGPTPVNVSQPNGERNTRKTKTDIPLLPYESTEHFKTAYLCEAIVAEDEEWRLNARELDLDCLISL